LLTSRQKRDETPQEFSQNIVPKVSDPILEKVHCDQAQHMSLAANISGLSGNPGQHVRFRMPQNHGRCSPNSIHSPQGRSQKKKQGKFIQLQKIVREMWKA
jgi:protoporphyrinogen oxidase